MVEGKPGMTAGRKIALCVVLLAVVLCASGIGLAVAYPGQASHLARDAFRFLTPGSNGAPGVDAADVTDVKATVDPLYVEVTEETPTRQIAAYGDIPLYSPIAQRNLTGVLFHQASYPTARVITTQLPYRSAEGVGVDNPVRVNRNQDTGDWVDADALHLYRMTDTTDIDTSIDVGAPWGSIVYAPVTGTVVLVKDYDLYGYVPDVQIHIQPEGHPELDLVLLHQYDPMVKAGDVVEGGKTPLSRVRDIAASLTDVQLGFYTPPDDPGNHSHVQLNDANYPGYREDSLKGAYQVPVG